MPLALAVFAGPGGPLRIASAAWLALPHSCGGPESCSQREDFVLFSRGRNVDWYKAGRTAAHPGANGAPAALSTDTVAAVRVSAADLAQAVLCRLGRRWPIFDALRFGALHRDADGAVFF